MHELILFFVIQDSYPPIPQLPPNSSYNNNNNTQPQPSKSTNIIPVKGTINVENLDKFSDDDRGYNKNNNSRSPITPTESPKDYFSRSVTSEKPPNVSKILGILNLQF